MNKKINYSKLALLKVLTLVFVITISFTIVNDVMAQESESEKSTVVKILEILFGNTPDTTPTPIPKPLCRPLASSGDSTGGGDDIYTDFSGTVDTSFNYADYGLPQPQEAGTESLFQSIGSNTNMAFWARRLLNSEKALIAKGVRVKPYLTTAWMWFEGGITPYSINCNDNRAGFSSEVSFFCSVRNFQVAGYQAATRRNDYVNIFNKCYGSGTAVSSVLKNVVNNSSYVGTAKWSYKDPGQQGKGLMQYMSSVNSATIANISPNSSFSDQKTQFLTLMLGKDPCMAIGLNSYAVSDSDLVRALKGNGYGYIKAPQKQRIANMIAALKKFDGRNIGTATSPTARVSGSPAPSSSTSVTPASGTPASSTAAPTNGIDPYAGLPDCDAFGNPQVNATPDPNVTAGPLGDANIDNYTHYCQCDPQWGPSSGGMCQAGCGLNSIASAMTSLGRPTKPTELRALWEGKHWFPNQGMNTTRAALQSGWIDQQGFHWDGTNLMSGSRVNTVAAKRYFTGDLKNRCVIIGSFNRFVPGFGQASHIVAISGINDDGTMTVHDSWLGCNPGSTSEKVSYRRQNSDYVNYYAYPLCRKK